MSKKEPRFGVVRNGEHTKLFDTEIEAKAHIAAEKAWNKALGHLWGVDAATVQYHIEKVSRRKAW